jgi:hypothetical protein
MVKCLYQKPPQLATHGSEDDPEGISFWKIKHGIRLTGMPSFDIADTKMVQTEISCKDHLEACIHTRRDSDLRRKGVHGCTPPHRLSCGEG